VAQVRNVRLVDDLDGNGADETVEFGFDGRSYSIDLSAENARRLREVFAQYVPAARRTGGRRTGGGRTRVDRAQVDPVTVRRAASDREQNRAIREWARKRALDVSDRGRIPAGVLAAYHAGRS